MVRTRRILPFLLLLTVMPGRGWAGQIFHLPLADVVSDASWIIRAKVVSAERSHAEGRHNAEYRVTPTGVLKGPAAVPEHITLSYSEHVPVSRDEQGHTVLRVSPVFPGSGKEFSVRAEEEWIFLLYSETLSGNGPTHILRAEPAALGDEILRLSAGAQNPEKAVASEGDGNR